MQTESNELSGKVILDPLRLRQLRRSRGLSQGALAELCLDKRLYVSVSSLKRAERGMPVLYRTAGHLAMFYAVDINSLMRRSAITPNEAEIGDQGGLTVAICQPHDNDRLFDVLRQEIQKLGGTIERIA